MFPRPFVMKQVYLAQSPEDADMAAEQLRAAGIGAVVNSDRVAAPSVPYPSVWVRESDVQAAQEILQDRLDLYGGAV